MRLPTAEDLDTGGWGAASGFKFELYLVPGGETNDLVPEVVWHSGLGSIGTPMHAFHGRWLLIGRVPPNAVGASVREALEGITDELVAMSAAYEGSVFDGSNLVGEWSDDVGSVEGDLVLAWENAVEGLALYWAAGDWLAECTWPELCRDAEVDPDGADLAAAAVVAHVMAGQAHDVVLGAADVEEVVAGMRVSWQEDQEAERKEAFEVLVDEAESFLDLADSEGIIRPGVLRRLYPGRPEWHGASNWRTAAAALEGCTPEAMDEAVRRAGSSR